MKLFDPLRSYFSDRRSAAGIAPPLSDCNFGRAYPRSADIEQFMRMRSRFKLVQISELRRDPKELRSRKSAKEGLQKNKNRVQSGPTSLDVLCRKTGLVTRSVDSDQIGSLFDELERYDSRERAQTFDYLKRALNKTRSSLRQKLHTGKIRNCWLVGTKMDAVYRSANLASGKNDQTSFWCLFGVYYERAPERLKRIWLTKEKRRKFYDSGRPGDLVDVKEVRRSHESVSPLRQINP